MKIHRFFVNQKLAEGSFELTDPALVRQIKDVLKLHVGESVKLFNNGLEATTIISEFSKKKITFSITQISNIQYPNIVVSLFCSILKNENFELVVQKATELGITKIVPLITDRTIKKNINLERLKKITIEAAEQSGRVFIPEISTPVKFSNAVKTPGRNVFCDFGDTKLSPTDFAGSKDINIFIGPEGGWTEAEQKLAIENGCLVRSLGANILRAETAAIVASYLVCNGN